MLVPSNPVDRFRIRKYGRGDKIDYDAVGDNAFGNSSSAKKSNNRLASNLRQSNRLTSNLGQSNRLGLKSGLAKRRGISFYGTYAGGRIRDEFSKLNGLNNGGEDSGEKTLLIAAGFDPEAFSTVGDFLLGLNDFFASMGDTENQVLVDGLWGNQTQRAYLMALLAAKSRLPETIESYGDPNGLIIKSKPLVPELLPVEPQLVNVSTPIRNNNYSREGIRGLIRGFNLNPYDYTGLLRKALRRYLNGESNDTSLLDGTDLARLTLMYR